MPKWKLWDFNIDTTGHMDPNVVREVTEEEVLHELLSNGAIDTSEYMKYSKATTFEKEVYWTDLFNREGYARNSERANEWIAGEGFKPHVMKEGLSTSERIQALQFALAMRDMQDINEITD